MLTLDQQRDLALKYGSKSNVYRAAIKSGLTDNVVALAFGVSRRNVYAKCYYNNPRARIENKKLFALARKLDPADAELIWKASGVRKLSFAQRRRRARPGLADSVRKKL